MSERPRRFLRLEDLRTAINRTLDAVDRLGPAVGLDQAGYYWDLPWDVAYAFDGDAGLRVGVGDTLHDDIELMEEVLAGRPSVLAHELAHLAELLRWLAFQAEPRLPNERRADVSDEQVLLLLRGQWRRRSGDTHER